MPPLGDGISFYSSTEGAAMSTWTASSISRSGRLTIPQKLRARLAPREDSKVLLQEVADGVILLSKEPLARPQIAEYLLDSLVTGIGPEAELLGFHDEEDLDRVVAVIRERTFALQTPLTTALKYG